MKKTLLLLLLPLVLLLPMCHGGSSDGTGLPTGTSSDGSSSGAPVNLRVFLTDSPADAYTAVLVTVSALRIHESSDAEETAAGWKELPITAAMPVDLLTLRNGVLLGLGSALLPAGHYQQIRLVLTPNAGAVAPFKNYVVVDGVSHPLDVPSGSIKIVHQFSLDAAQVTDLTLDFDAASSVKQQGNGDYFLQPVIRAASTTAS